MKVHTEDIQKKAEGDLTALVCDTYKVRGVLLISIGKQPHYMESKTPSLFTKYIYASISSNQFGNGDTAHSCVKLDGYDLVNQCLIVCVTLMYMYNCIIFFNVAPDKMT